MFYVFDMNTWLAVPNALRSHSSAHVGVIGGLVRKSERLRNMSATLCFLVIQRIQPHFFLFQRKNYYHFYLSNGKITTNFQNHLKRLVSGL